MTTKERTHTWLEQMIPGNGVGALLERAIGYIYHQDVLHADEALENAERLQSPFLRRIVRIEKGWAEFIMRLKPDLKEYLDHSHTHHPQHHYK